ncbi:putative transcription factor ZF-HD family [Medicago truncatula]|uniref:Putative transcription factor ZF-HD family n=1 Tax=Medicago truncatula TaxID=3880 RepID=A0A072TNS1_MEDTR|nr:zinc-finger homeodomain protein 1 [Medicago truncatula]KEH19154.1 ZF-HD protein dimerization region protein [Medicago truncatula]RHN40705.1 putative transcription factor ZF-HD family [Medicago truncatula]
MLPENVTVFNGKYSSIGGYSLDGCREFLPAGAEGATNFFKCTACKCHKNFHCIVPATNLVVPSKNGIHISWEELEENVHVRNVEPINDDGRDGARQGTSNSNKWFRTKFTHEQRKKMLDFAMTLGWKTKKNDENVVEEF